MMPLLLSLMLVPALTGTGQAGLPELPRTPQAPAAVAAHTAPATAPSEAYYQFMLGRRLEGEGDVEGAIQAYLRASQADPAGSEIAAELAALFARQNRPEEAIQAAERALVIDPDNAEAHAVLGGVYAARVQGEREAPQGGALREDETRAIAHLEKARSVRRYDVGLQLSLGRLQFARGDYEAAIKVLTELTEQEPGVNEAMWLLAQSYEATGRRGAAIATLENAVSAEPRFYRALLTLAELYERERRWKDAADTYARAAELNPRAPELRVRQATALLSGGEPARARDLLAPLVSENPTDAGALFALSESYRGVKDLDAAERTARELMALEPKGVRGPYALALVLDERHDSRGVIAALEPVVRQHQSGEPAARSQISPLLVRLGYAYQELGQMDKAVATFERARAVAADPSTLDPFVAQAYIAAGQYERALALLQKGRKEEPDDPRLLRLEADALQRSGRTDEAIRLLSEHEAKFADDVEVQLAYGSLLAEGGRIDRATRLFDDLDRRFPGRAEVAFQRGAAMEQAKRYAEAEAAFRQALERDPLHAPTLNYFGYMLAERGERLDEAVELVERALKVDPANPSYLDSLGWAYYQKGEYSRAKEYLARAADRLPRNSVVQDHLGDVLSKLGDRSAAVAAWERALAGDGESIDAGTIRKKISEGRRAPE